MSIEDPRRDPVVIARLARTPMGGFQGDLARRRRRNWARPRSAPRSSGRASSPTTIEEVIMGCVLPAGLGQAPARQASLGAGMPEVGRLHHHQQDVRVGHEGGHAGPRPDRGRHRRHHGRGRHGEHDQRALSAGPCPRRLPHGPRPGDRPHVPRRAGGRLRQGPPDGHLRRGLRPALPVHPRSPGRLCRRLADPCPQGGRRAAPSTPRSRRSTVRTRKGESQVDA